MSGRRAGRARRGRLFGGAAAAPLPARAAAGAGAFRGAIGLDVGAEPRRAGLRLGRWLPVFALALACALALAALRVSILRARYALAEVHESETQLLEARRDAQVEIRELRDPRRLRERARALGFEHPERVLRLPAAAAGAAPAREAP